MRSSLAALFLSVLVACGHGSSSGSQSGSGGPPPPPPPPPVSTPMPRITLQAPQTGPLVLPLAPIGSVTPTMIVTDQGQFYYETSDFQFAKGVILVDGQGNVTLQGATLTSPAGTTQDFLFTGTYISGTLSGTSNAGAVNLVSTGLQAVTVDFNAAAGNYISTSVSTGKTTYLQLKADGTFGGQDYISPADYPQYFAGVYTGALTGSGPVANAFNVSAQYLASGQPSPYPFSFGYAMFDGSGNLLIFSANTGNSNGDMQFSGVFLKQ